MRCLIVIYTIIGITCARPQLGLGGYNYEQSLSPTNNDQISPSEQYPPGPVIPEVPIVNKHFYIHSAPEDTDSNRQPKHFSLGKPQKNYRVVFIKAPSSGLANSQLSAEYAPQEEKTHIYVLSQKEHEINLNDIGTPAPTQPSKPEVFFIKYKTPQEAEHAQRQIQAQYDALGGASQITDEGIAPHSSFVGALGSSAPLNKANNYIPPKLNNDYIPPKLNNAYVPSRGF